MNARGLLLLAILAVASPGCGDPVKALRELPRPDGLHWHAEPVDAIAPWGLGAPPPRRFLIPEGTNTHSFRRSEFPSLTVNLLPSGDVRFKGNTYKFRTGTPLQQRGARVALSNELSRLVAAREFVDGGGFSRVSFCIYGTREAPWSVASETIDLALSAPHPIRSLGWAVDNPTLAADQFVTARMDSVGDVVPNALRIRLSASAPDLDTGTQTRLVIGAREWTFADQTMGFADLEFLARANEVWSEIEAWLPSVASEAPPAWIEIDDGEGELWWAYVAKVIDLLLGVGIRDVSLPDADLHLALADPDEVEVISMVDEPVLAWQTIVGCLLAVLIAFTITFLPRARPRR